MRRTRPLRRAAAAASVAACSLFAGACTQTIGRAQKPDAGTAPSHHRRDRETATSLLRIARTFNDDYQENKDAAVYARWDSASRAIISEATYVRRHRECPNASHVAVDTWGVTRGPGGAWLVHYSIDGQQLTDWWYYVDGRFVFDLPRSNPSAVHLYRASPAQYAKETGCRH